MSKLVKRFFSDPMLNVVIADTTAKGVGSMRLAFDSLQSAGDCLSAMRVFGANAEHLSQIRKLLRNIDKTNEWFQREQVYMLDYAIDLHVLVKRISVLTKKQLKMFAS